MMADEPNPTTTAAPQDKPKEAAASHGVRMRDADWTRWQEIVGSYPSAADAFGDLMSLAQMRSMGTKAGMSAKVDLVAQHTKQIVDIYTELLQTMDDQSRLSTEKLTEADRRCQVQIQAAHDAEVTAKAETKEAKDAATDAIKSRDALRIERDKLAEDREAAIRIQKSALNALEVAKEDIKDLRTENTKAKTDINALQTQVTDLQAQLQKIKAQLAEAQIASKLAETEKASLTAQLATKDQTIQVLQALVASLQTEARTKTPAKAAPQSPISASDPDQLSLSESV